MHRQSDKKALPFNFLSKKTIKIGKEIHRIKLFGKLFNFFLSKISPFKIIKLTL